MLSESDDTFIRDGNENGFGCGDVNDDGKLYLIDEKNQVAYLLPEKYWQTELCLYPSCCGYQDGMIMVSLTGELDLQYHHDLYAAAGIWGWIDLEGNEIIPPQYPFALHFCNGEALVCKGDWTVDENGRYWCENEIWGTIDTKGNEIIPCRFDELTDIGNTERYWFCHKDGWEDGCNCIYDKEKDEIIAELDFNFDIHYMFNECYYDNGLIIFDKHIPGKETDYLYVFSVEKQEWVIYHERLEKREFNGETKMEVEKDGEKIIVF